MALDIYRDNLAALLHFDEAVGELRAKDDSPTGVDWDCYGDAAIAADGVYANRVVSTNGGITRSEASTLFDFGIGDFTFECRMMYTGTMPSDMRLFGSTDASSTMGIGSINFGSNFGIVQEGVAWRVELAWTKPLAGVWVALAITRSSGVCRLFLNGVLQSSVANTTNWTMGTGRPKFVLGNGSTLSLDEVRITKGIARYTANYTTASDRFPGGVAKVPTDHIALYTMDDIVGDTLKDETGSYSMTMFGSPATEAGVIGNALRFDGTDEYAHTSSPIPSMSAFSVLTWIKYIGSTTKHQTILVDSDTSSFAFKFWPNGRVYFYDGATVYFGTSSSDINGYLLELAKWTHLTLQSTGTELELYVNGVLFSSLTATYSFVSTNIATGRAHSGAGGIIERSNLAIDQLRIYDRALTQSEIDAIYTEGSLLNGLQVHYTMDNISGTTLFDETGNYDAVITGTEQVDGYLGKALRFDGTNKKIEFVSPLLGAKFGFSIWFKFSATTDSSTFYSKRNGASSNDVQLYYEKSSSEIALLCFALSPSIKLVPFSPVIGQWYHIVGSYNGAELAIYVNGVKYSVASSGTPTNVATSARIGDDWFGHYAQGDVDQFRMYSRALNQVDVDALYYEEILTKILAGTITETLGVTNWHVRTYRIDNGILTGTIDTTDGTFSIDVGFNNGVPHMITVTPDQGLPWTRSTAKIVGSLCYPTDPNATPYYYKSLSIGATDTTEPAWVTTPGLTVVDGGVTWECVERLVQPITQSPLIPV